MSDEIATLAAKLGITEIQLAKLRVRYERKHEGRGDEKLLSWLKTQWAEIRDHKWLLSRRSVPPYTESPSEALTDAGEAVPPGEIETYRASRDARLKHQQERIAEVDDLLAAMTELRGVLNAMPRERTRRMGRSLWILRSRLDAAERDLRRRLAA